MAITYQCDRCGTTSETPDTAIGTFVLVEHKGLATGKRELELCRQCRATFRIIFDRFMGEIQEAKEKKAALKSNRKPVEAAEKVK